MTTKEFKFYLHYIEKHSSVEQPFFVLSEVKHMEDNGWTLIREVPILVEIPDHRELAKQRLDALDKLEQDTRAKFAAAMEMIRGRRSSLLAIENTVDA